MSSNSAKGKVREKKWYLPKKLQFRHYFGGSALILFVLQFLTGLYMIFYYEPALRDTYKIVQYFNNEVFLGAFTRNLHRYGAFFLLLAAVIHLWRGYSRRDYQGKRKVTWLTGLFLFLTFSALVVSGSILPWEWKGYWMMEMVTNWLKVFPVFGDSLYDFFMMSYTPTRNFVVHDIVLPLTAYILLQYHCLANMEKRGLWQNLARQAVAAVPLIVLVIVMSLLWPVPAADPEQIPLPMAGRYVPAPEWYFVSFLMPIWYYPPRDWVIFLFWLPLALFGLLAILPFINKRLTREERERKSNRTLKWMGITYMFTGVLVVGVFLFGGTVASVKAPWMGCNSCHNRAMGDRMGIPPITYKDRERNPVVLDSRWMMRHWYEPQVVW